MVSMISGLSKLRRTTVIDQANVLYEKIGLPGDRDGGHFVIIHIHRRTADNYLLIDGFLGGRDGYQHSGKESKAHCFHASSCECLEGYKSKLFGRPALQDYSCAISFSGKQVVAQLLVHSRVFTADPLEHHRRVFFFLVAVVRKNSGKLFVLAGIDALVVPVDRFKLFHQRRNRAVHVPCFRRSVLRSVRDIPR